MKGWALGEPSAQMKSKQEGRAMSRNLKALGLAMVAALALSAVAASAAQAANHHLTTTAPAVVTAEDTVNTVFSITNGNREVECTTSKYEGTVSESTSTETTVTPTYSGCKIKNVGISATVDVNHCAYILKGDTDVNGDATSELECAGTDEITITYSVLGSSCVVHVTPGAYRGVHYAEETVGGLKQVKVTVTVTGIKWHETGGGFCPASATGEDGTLNGTVVAKAYADSGSALSGTEKTTPTLSEGAQQDLALTTT